VTDVEVVQAIYAALGARDVDRLFSLVDPAIVLTQDDRLPWGGRFEGHEGFADFAARLTGTIASQVTTDAMFEADGDVVQAGRTKGTVVATGAAFDVAEVHRWTVRDGRAVRAHFAIDVPAMLEALAAGR
jgi:uncharacterized protein